MADAGETVFYPTGRYKLANQKGPGSYVEAVDDTSGTHASNACSIAGYTAEQFYQYVAMIEMIYELATNEKAREELLQKLSESAGAHLLQGVEDWFSSVMSRAEAEIFYRQNRGRNAHIDQIASDRMASSRYYKDRASAHFQQAMEKLKNYFTQYWREIKKRYHECGWFYAAATVGIDGAFTLGELAIGAGIGGLAIKGLKGLRFAARGTGSGKIRVEVRSDTSEKSLTREWSKPELEAKYGKPQDNHGGTTSKETNKPLPEKSAKDAKKEKDESATGGQHKDVDPDNRLDETADGEKTVDGKRVSESSSNEKGNFGEAMADQDMLNNGATKLNGPMTQIGDKIDKGIDGVYTNPGGNPPYIIGDAKYGSAGLGKANNPSVPGTKYKQMSPEWINDRLIDAVGKAKAKEIMAGGYKRVVQKVDKNGKVVVKDLDTGKILFREE